MHKKTEKGTGRIQVNSASGGGVGANLVFALILVFTLIPILVLNRANTRFAPTINPVITRFVTSGQYYDLVKMTGHQHIFIQDNISKLFRQP